MKQIKGQHPQNQNSPVFFIISVSSWLLFLVTAWSSIGLPHPFKDRKYFWLTFSLYLNSESEPSYYPLAMNIVVHYIVFAFIFTLATLGFLVYMTYRDDNNVTDGMLGAISKFHFIPLLCISALFIIGESLDGSDPNRAMFIFDFIFSIVGLASLILIKTQTKIESPWYAIFTIKEGTYSCLIVLLIYNIGYNFTYYGLYEMGGYNKDANSNIAWKVGCGIVFPLIIGLANLILSILFQDFMIASMNILIYIGMIINFYNTDRDERSEAGAKAEGIIDIVILSLSASTVLFLILRCKPEIYNNNY